MCKRRAVWRAPATVVLAAVFLASDVHAQSPASLSREPSSRAILGAIEDVLASAIEKAEASVVSIARVRDGDQKGETDEGRYFVIGRRVWW